MSSIQRIVVPVDFSSHSRAAIVRAIQLARAHGAEIELLHVIGSPIVVGFAEYPIPPGAWAAIREEAAAEIEKLRAQVEEAGGAARAEVREGNPLATIRSVVGERDGALVALGTQGRTGLGRFFLGSVAERVLRTVPCPVLAVKEDEASASQPIQRILLATDFSPSARCAGQHAVALARKLGAHLDAVHVYEVPADYLPYTIPLGPDVVERLRTHAAEQLDEELRVLDAGDLQPGTHVLRGQPSGLIAAESERLGSQLIVMGTRGNTGPRHLVLGSVAERTLRLASSSVMAVKEPPQE